MHNINHKSNHFPFNFVLIQYFLMELINSYIIHFHINEILIYIILVIILYIKNY